VIVMPADNTNALTLAKQFPGRIGMLYGIDRWKSPRGLPYALDNGRFPVWAKGKTWDEAKFLRLIERAKHVGYEPEWLAVPDVVCDAAATEKEWGKWVARFEREYGPDGIGWNLALCVQDGMTPASVKRLVRQPDVIFVGGSKRWKMRHVWMWCQEFPHVHVGRVNWESCLWYCHRCGAESCDGTGWFRGNQRQLAGLLRYLRQSMPGAFVPQLEFTFEGGE
jgi:hypothetical protein